MKCHDDNLLLRVQNVSKRFPMNRPEQRYIVNLLQRLARAPLPARRTPDRFFWPLSDVSFDLMRGETIALIGENGSGKSTLLKVIANILEPTTGSVEVYGRQAALLELGAGFHPELTGRENVYLNSSILGLSRREVNTYIDKIVDFADIGPFIDSPVKHYSSGMRVRLGFSIAVHVRPDILLVDEVLAVGDENFQHKCLEAFHEFRRHGGSLVLVSHSLEMVRNMCCRAVWLDQGKVQADGGVDDVLAQYVRHVHSKEEKALRRGDGVVTVTGDKALRWGDQAVTIDRVRLLDGTNEETQLIHTGDPLSVEIDYTVQRTPEGPPAVGIAFVRHDDLWCYGTNTKLDRVATDVMRLPPSGHGAVRLNFDGLQLLPGTYFLDVALQNEDNGDHDYWRRCTQLTVRSIIKDSGVARLEHTWSFGEGVAIPAPDVSLVETSGP